jgi:hypothetical protein
MLSRLEKIGLLSILEEQIKVAEDDHLRHRENSRMEDQSEGYRNTQHAESRFYEGLALGFKKARNEIKNIPTE